MKIMIPLKIIFNVKNKTDFTKIVLKIFRYLKFLIITSDHQIPIFTIFTMSKNNLYEINYRKHTLWNTYYALWFSKSLLFLRTTQLINIYKYL